LHDLGVALRTGNAERQPQRLLVSHRRLRWCRFARLEQDLRELSLVGDVLLVEVRAVFVALMSTVAEAILSVQCRIQKCF
jgi:hypothetical protein